MKHLFIFYIFISAATAILCSCSFFCTTEIQTFTIKISDCDNNKPITVYYIDTDGNAASFYATQKFSCRVNKNMATPFFTDTGYGTIYPYSTELNTAGAFVADILYSMYLGSTDSPKQTQEYLSHFNWERFIQEVNKFPDPQKLDRQRIMTAIANRTFKKTDLRLISQ